MNKTSVLRKDHRIIILPPKITAIQGPDNYPSDVTTMLQPKFVSIPYGRFSHTHTQYQIATDPDFNNIIVDVTTDTDLYSKMFSSDLFEPSTTYYVRVRFKDSNEGVVSDWVVSSFLISSGGQIESVSIEISTDFIKTAGVDISNGKLEPIAYQDIIDPNYTSTTTEIYIDYNKIELQVGDLLKTDNDEYFQVQSINYDGDSYIITPDHTLDNPPNEIYFIGHRAIAIKEFQDDWNEVVNITATEQTQNVLDANNPSTANKIYINNQLIDVKPGDVFNTDNNELFEVAVVDNEGVWVYEGYVKSVACGLTKIVIIREDNSVWTIESSMVGGPEGSEGGAQFTNTGLTAKQVACGDWHTVILTEDGYVWVTGSNYYGQLGLGDTNDRHEFTNTGITAQQVACGSNHTVIIRDDNSVWVTGRNYYGQLGLGDRNDRYQFTNTGITAKSVACGGDHTVIIREDNSVWSVGGNWMGQLGLDDNPADRYEFTNTGVTAKQIACGKLHTAIIKDDNSVWVTGCNEHGQLGLGDTTNRYEFTNTGITAQQVACGSNHTAIIKADGSVWVTGYNYWGQLGLGDTNDRNQFTNTGMVAEYVACGGDRTAVIRKDNQSLWWTGKVPNGTFPQREEPTSIEFIDSGALNSSFHEVHRVTPSNPLSQPPTAVYPVSKFNINGIQLQPNPIYDSGTGLQNYTFQDINLPQPSNVIKLSVDISDVTIVTEISMDLKKNI